MTEPAPRDPPAAAWAAAYAAVERRVADVVGAGDCGRAVPACPGWTVHDVVAHLAGLCQDWVDGRTDGYASAGWTADHVARFEGRSCAQVLDSWAAMLGSFGEVREEMLGAPPGRWAFGDAVIHEADLRGALDAGRVPHDDLSRALGLLMPRWCREVPPPAGLPAVDVRATGAGSWVLGLAEGGPVSARVEVPPYELFRAVVGRRSAAQVRTWDWPVDPEPIVAAGLPYPFSWASEDLVD